MPFKCRAQRIVTACVAVLSVVLARGCNYAGTQNSQSSTHKHPMRTQMGTPLSLPSGISPGSVSGFPTYSSEGEYLAIELLGGDVGIIRTDGTGSFLVSQHFTLGSANSYGSPQWIAPNRLSLAEHSIESVGSPERSRPLTALRVVEITSDELRPIEMSAPPTGISFAGHLSQDRLVGYDAAQGEYRIINNDGTVGETIATVASVEFIPAAGSFPWIVRQVGDRESPFGSPVTLELINLETGLRRSVTSFPRPSPFGVVLDANADWIVSANFLTSLGWVPFMYDVTNARRHSVPPGESWVPVSINRANETILVLLYDPSTPADRSWAELPLVSLLPAD